MRRKPENRNRLQWGALALCLWLSVWLPATALAASPPAGTSILNTAVVAYNDANGSSLPSQSASVQTIVSGAPVLKITKLDSVDPVSSGATLTYTLQYENTGNSPATNVILSDSLSKHVIFQSASGGDLYTPAPPGGGTVSWNIGTLASGQIGSLTITTRVKTPAEYTPGDPDTITIGTLISNTATLTATEGFDSQTITITVGSAPNLVVVKSTTSGPVLPGGTLTYTIHYENRGNSPATNIRITDNLPSGVAYQSGSITAGGTISGPTLTWNLGTLSAGASGDVGFKVTVSPLATNGQTVQNTAVILSNELGVISSNTVTNTVSTTSGLPSLSIVKTDSPDPVYVNNPITYTIAATNDGTAALTNVVIKDPVPANTTFISADGVGTLSDNAVIWNIPSLAAGATQTVNMTVQVNAAVVEGSVIQNTAEVIAQEILYPTPTTTTTVSARTPAQILFMTAGMTPTHSYHVGDTICIQVTDLDQNKDPNAVESVSVTLADNKTGDSETLVLTETGLNTRIFRGCLLSVTEPMNSENGTISVSPDSALRVTYMDPFDASPVSQDSALIDPFGIVFDSVTGVPLAGFVVTLRISPSGALASTAPGWPPAQPDIVTTGPTGSYAFPLVPPGSYYLDVTPAAPYTFPSSVATADLPPGFVIGVGSRGEVFSLAPLDPALNLDLPADPPSGRLSVTKTANKNEAAIGDFVGYSVTVNNPGTAPTAAVKLYDTLPHGFRYMKKSTRMDGIAAADPETGRSRTLIWLLGTIAGGKSKTISYTVVLGPDSPKGNGKNSAYAGGSTLGRNITSNIATKKIKITQGVFTSSGTIIGKVFIDSNADSLQQHVTADGRELESGIPGVVIYMEDGTRVETDPDGKFSIYGVKPGTHVLRVDTASLPEDVELVPISNRFLGSASSQFVDMVYGQIYKANFAAKRKTTVRDDRRPILPAQDTPAAASEQPKPESPPVLQPPESSATEKDKLEKIDPPKPEASLQPVVSESASPAAAAQAAPVTTAPAATSQPAVTSTADRPPVNLEEQIKGMTPDLAILKPRDGDLIAKGHVHILVKAPLETHLSLEVNGQPISEKRIGRTLSYQPGRVAVTEYVGVDLKTGEVNTIQAQIKDPFDNIRGRQAIRVTAVGSPDRIDIRPQLKEIPADGRTRAAVSVSILDKNGHPVPYPAMITVATTAGEIVEKDWDPMTGGHQIEVQNGGATFSVQAPFESRTAEITARYETLKETAKIFFAPHLRNLFAVGFGEIKLGYGQKSGSWEFLKKDRSFDDGAFADARGAAFVKGDIGWGVLLTAAFDSGKEETDELFRTPDTDLTSEGKYPIYGDESRQEYEALSREKLYIRLDKDRSSLLFGDYDTNLNESRLGAYSRSFNGFKSDIQTDRFSLRSFVSYTDQTQVVDILPAKGVSGYYYLQHNPAVDGSEKVVLETRSRRQPDRVLKRQLMTRWTDYDINYDDGSILFKEPVSSRDADFNPVYIVVSYESKDSGAKYYIYGGRGAVRLTPWMELGVTDIVEEKEVDDYHLFGGDVTFTLPARTTLKAEWTQTDSTFDIDNVYAPKTGDGWSVEIGSKPTERLDLSGYYRNLSSYFSNPSAVDVMRGSEKYGLDAAYRLQPDLLLRGKHFNETDELNNGEYRLSSVDMEKKYKKTTVTVGISYETSEDDYIPAANLTSRDPFDISEETPEDLIAARAGLETRLTPDLSFLDGHKQDLQHNRYNLTHAGLSYKIDSLSRTYVRKEYGTYDDRREDRTLIGVEADVAKDTVEYSEYRLENGADGARNYRVIGLRNKFKLTESLGGNVSLENLHTRGGEQRKGEPDGFAVSTGLQYLPTDRLKLTSRFEYKDEKSDPDLISHLIEVGLGYKLHPDYSLLARERYYSEVLGGNQGKRIRSRTTLGLAYRPVRYDRFNALAKIELKNEQDTIQTPDENSDAYIGSMEGHYQTSRRLQLIGKYAGKLVLENEFQSYTDLISARFIYDLTDRIDIGAEYRLLTGHDVDSRSHGGSIEAGYRLVKNLWLSLGYSFDAFDSDLTADNYWGKGPFMRIRFKFDETTFRHSTRN
ncbi:MAG: hypothetical protein P1P89_18875 [Desulfobacterales bacterium]|nr:hypothetical protein [Desulfobacterales bacterium]